MQLTHCFPIAHIPPSSAERAPRCPSPASGWGSPRALAAPGCPSSKTRRRSLETRRSARANSWNCQDERDLFCQSRRNAFLFGMPSLTRQTDRQTDNCIRTFVVSHSVVYLHIQGRAKEMALSRENWGRTFRNRLIGLSMAGRDGWQQWGREFLNMGHFFCTTLYIACLAYYYCDVCNLQRHRADHGRRGHRPRNSQNRRRPRPGANFAWLLAAIAAAQPVCYLVRRSRLEKRAGGIKLRGKAVKGGFDIRPSRKQLVLARSSEWTRPACMPSAQCRLEFEVARSPGHG